jgi:DNA-3-methyladenine glycosylase I
VKKLSRCSWAGNDEQMIRYHDTEWGVPVYNDRKLFEFLVLESAQAGLSWKTILHRRNGYKKAFANFDYKKVAKFGARDVTRLMKNSGIIRNRLKILATISNAQKFIEVQKEFGSFHAYMWGFVENKQLDGKRSSHNSLPAVTPESIAFSKDLKKRGFSFLGPTICYAHMQAVGMANDHMTNCFRYQECKKIQKAFTK